MPTYEFRCPHGHEFEKFYRTISGAEAQALCPQCGEPAERFMSATGFAFKGSGFYLTDYGKNAHRDKGTPNGKGAAPSAEGAKSESGGSEGPKAEAGSGAGGGDAGKAGEAKKPAPAADSKPPAAPPKKSSDE